MKRKAVLLLITAYGISGCLLAGCGESASLPSNPGANTQSTQAVNPNSDGTTDLSGDAAPTSATPSKGSRDNTPKCLVPQSDGSLVFTNDVGFIDASHVADGYVNVKYIGDCETVKVLITPEGEGAYTYNLIGNEYETFPLTSGSKSYKVAVYTQVSGTQYATCISEDIPVTITDEFGPFLFPNQYVKFTSSSNVVSKAKELVEPANSDLEAVTYVYNYVTGNIVYDYDKAQTVPGGYTADVDEILSIKKGICLDYAAVMASMLRSQGIPTHLEVGYAGEAYHAWISVYITDVGWINGIIQFDGKNWSIVDPTFAANSSESTLKKFIGDGSNYQVKFVY